MTIEPNSRLSRREWLRLVGTAAAATACAPVQGNASDSSASAVDLAPGIQLYAVRTEAARDLDATLTALAGMGYREVEMAGLYNRTAQSVRASLDRAGLRAPSSHIGVERLRGDAFGPTLEEARILGSTYIIVPWVDPRTYKTAGDWRRLADELSALGPRVKERGFQLGYHNHDFELRPLADGAIPYDILLASDPSTVKMEMDIFWVVQGGGDPMAYIQKHPGRFVAVHVKDRTADGNQTDVGKGTIDFATIYANASKAGIRHAFVEHDQPPDPLAFARASVAHVRTLRAR